MKIASRGKTFGSEQGIYEFFSLLVREGVKKNFHYKGGIFHGALTPPPLPWKIIKFFARDS